MPTATTTEYPLVQFCIMIPVELRAAIKREAADRNETVNRIVTETLRRSFPAERKAKAAK